MMLGEIAADASLTRIEEEVRRFWRRHAIPEAAHAAHRNGPLYVIHQEPLSVAEQGWKDQVRLLATADLYARYYTMQAGAVYLHTGWSCHGLALERLVEEWARPAPDGMADFVETCREMAVQSMSQVENQFERLGLWRTSPPDFVSLHPKAIGLVWSTLRRLWDAGRLRRELQVVSVCPRCATPLSTVEATRRSREIQASAVWVRLPWEGEPNTYFLIWTPSPWMLVGLVALAAHPEASYALVEEAGDEGDPPTRLLLAEAALGQALSRGYRLVRRLPGKMLRGARYHPPFTFAPGDRAMNSVIADSSVAVDRGVGLMPVMPVFDPLSLALSRAHELPIPELLDDWGGLDDVITPWRGLSPLDAEPLIIGNLRERGLLYREQEVTRPEPLCPYCEATLLPVARPVWRIETTSGPWIVGRDRAWGTPLPVWTCADCGQEQCVAGLDDLAHRTGLAVEQIDPHRPAVDRLIFACPVCGGTMRRVAPVIDAALEAAVLAWATAPQPHPSASPASRPYQNLAIGLGDRDLGWLGDLAEIAALLDESLAWGQAVALPADDRCQGWTLKTSQPSDALRWAAYTCWAPEQAELQMLRPLWEFAASAIEQPESPAADPEMPVPDAVISRWLLARLHQATTTVTEALDRCEPQKAAEELSSLIRDLTQWRTVRPRASGEAMEVLTRLLAPFAPHLADAIYRKVEGRSLESVHLAEWPVPNPIWEDQGLLVRMVGVHRLAALGSRARAQAGAEADQVLPEAWISSLQRDEDEGTAWIPFHDLLAAQLGVEQVYVGPEAAARVEWRLALNPESVVDRAVRRDEIEMALAALRPEERASLAAQVRAGLSFHVDVGGQSVTLLPDEVVMEAEAESAWIAAADSRHLVLLRVG